jgi:hypothetical protein
VYVVIHTLSLFTLNLFAIFPLISYPKYYNQRVLSIIHHTSHISRQNPKLLNEKECGYNHHHPSIDANSKGHLQRHTDQKSKTKDSRYFHPNSKKQTNSNSKSNISTISNILSFLHLFYTLKTPSTFNPCPIPSVDIRPTPLQTMTHRTRIRTVRITSP